eukprot:gene1652-3198_t
MSIRDFAVQARSLLIPEQKKKAWYEEIEEDVCSVCPTLTWKQRVIGCLSFVFIGFVLTFGSTFRVVQLLAGNPAPFAVMYTLGNVIGMCATCFLFGPYSQAKKMMASNRIFATGIYFSMMGITLFLAFYPDPIPLRVILLMLAVILQFLALMWYTISYIPFAREAVIASFGSCCFSDK